MENNTILDGNNYKLTCRERGIGIYVDRYVRNIIIKNMKTAREMCRDRELEIDADCDEELPEDLKKYFREKNIEIHSEEEIEKTLVLLRRRIVSITVEFLLHELTTYQH